MVDTVEDNKSKRIKANMMDIPSSEQRKREKLFRSVTGGEATGCGETSLIKGMAVLVWE